MNIQNKKTSNMLTKEEKDAVIDYMVTKNSPSYNLTKAAEELLELATALLQRVNKGNRVSDKQITDEIGDVKTRLKVLEKIFPKEAIDERVIKKLTMFQDYIKTDKHKNI